MTRFWPFRQFGLKAWSIALAVLLWLVVAGEETVERGLRIPLELQQFPSGLELLSDAPSLVDVRVRGSSSTLSRLGPGDVVAVLDLHTAKAGRRLFQVTPEQVRVPPDVQVVQVQPPNIALTFEASETRQVPIVPAIEGTPAPGYVVASTTSQPKTVEVVGPASAVGRVTEALTEPVSVAGARDDVTDVVNVGFTDPTLRLKTPRQSTVVVHVTPGPEERTLRGHPVQLKRVGSGLLAQAVPPIADVVLRGTRQGLSKVDATAVVAFVDLDGLGPGDFSLGIQVDAPSDAGVARIIPATVQVHIGNR